MDPAGISCVGHRDVGGPVKKQAQSLDRTSDAHRLSKHEGVLDLLTEVDEPTERHSNPVVIASAGEDLPVIAPSKAGCFCGPIARNL
jgi:hypothetical protein